MRLCSALLILLLTAACTRPDAGDCPVDIAALAPAVADLQVAEAVSLEIPNNVRDSIVSDYFDSILVDHHLSRAEFDSLTWIIRQEPEWIDSLYTRVGIILAEMETNRRAPE